MPKFTVTVTELSNDASGVTQSTQEVFRQSVDAIDLPKLFAAVNAKPRKPRAPKVKAT